ncbi:MAG: UvrD-helicase domain-containing protein, partial [Clostridia bacterium]
MDSTKDNFIKLKKEYLERKFSFLNENQREGVFNTKGPLLILAGAGSGKTTVIINRIAFLIKYGNAYFEESNNEKEALELLTDYKSDNDEEIDDLIKCNPIPPYKVLAITFTNKAAKELRERLNKILCDEGSKVWAFTFHSTCVRILRMEIDKLEYSKSFTIYDTDDKIKIIKDCLKQFNLDDKIFIPRQIANIISKCKDSFISPDDYAKKNEGSIREKNISNIYKMYEKKLREANALDFDDLIVKTVQLFEEFPDVLKKYQKKFEYILVDEYQDTNTLQYKLISLLSKKHNNICVVGDDDQSIYKFRGATIENILSFEQQFKNAKVIRLERNYRSTENILKAANKLIENNVDRKGKNLWTDIGDGEKLYLYKAMNQEDEAKFIAKNINYLVNNDTFSLNDIAILYRTNAQNRAISDVLTKANIPNRVVGGVRFYDRAEIKDLLAYLSVISNPSDDLRLKRIINVPARKIGNTTIENILAITILENVSMLTVVENAKDYPSLLRALNSLTNFSNIITSIRAKIDKIPLNELYDEVCEKSGYVSYLENENTQEAKDKLENIAELSSVIVEFMKNNEEPTLAKFLEQVQLLSDIDNYDQASNAVTLMTIHSSKGLEFPVVFISGVEEGIFPSGL